MPDITQAIEQFEDNMPDMSYFDDISKAEPIDFDEHHKAVLLRITAEKWVSYDVE